jgi:formate dehydrogenase subunit gamma
MDRVTSVRAIATRYAARRGPLLPILHAVQSEHGSITRPDVVAIADVLNISIADVHGVVSFYSEFRSTPPPAHTIEVCRAEACQSVGGQALHDEIVARFADSSDVQVREVFCLGNCALGPSGTIDGRLCGRLSTDRIAALTKGWSA